MKLSSMAILLVAVGAMMIPAMPFAMAMPDPSSSSSDAVQNGDITLTFRQSQNDDPLIAEIIRVYDEPEEDILNVGLNACTTVPGPEDTDVDKTVWELRDAGDTSKVIGWEFKTTSGAPLDEVNVSFGTGVGSSGSPTIITVTGDSVILSDGSDVGSSQSVVWQEIITNAGATGTTEPSTDRIGEYTFRSCSSNIIDKYNVGDTFDIVLPIGGELLPISMAVLLVNGVSQSAFWLIPLIGAGAAFTLIGLQVHRKHA